MTTPTLPLPPLEVVAYTWKDLTKQGGIKTAIDFLGPGYIATSDLTPLVRLSDAQASIEEERAGRAIERELAEARANDAADLAVKLSDAQASLEALQAEMGELRKDKDRLDWIETNQKTVETHWWMSGAIGLPDRFLGFVVAHGDEPAMPLRAAIDSAIDQAASAGKESEG